MGRSITEHLPILLRESFFWQCGHLGPIRASKRKLIWAPISWQINSSTTYPSNRYKAWKFRTFKTPVAKPLDEGCVTQIFQNPSCIARGEPKNSQPHHKTHPKNTTPMVTKIDHSVEPERSGDSQRQIRPKSIQSQFVKPHPISKWCATLKKIHKYSCWRSFSKR